MQTRTYTRYAELFSWPLTIGLVAFTIELLLAAWRGPLP